MQPIASSDIKRRIEQDNPWWSNSSEGITEALSPRRVYFTTFKSLALNFDVRRAAILLGPRRVGKTFMIKQLIAEAIDEGIPPRSILYASVDTPVYSGMSIEKLIQHMPDEAPGKKKIIILDEIQYLRDWERHLKDLVDNHPAIKFIATGSAAAALRLKSRESGAGRFSEFTLPPLTFYEFLLFSGDDKKLIVPTRQAGATKRYTTDKINDLNNRFIDYLNYGGYPEAVLNEQIRKNPEQFIRSDIIDKVLLKDLPSLYGINEIQELNRLFSYLAYNTGNEASLENISKESGLTKPTIKKYIEYLESAFLIMKLPTVDDNCRTMKRERNFKIYLNNPSMRAALFGPIEANDSQKIGHLAESAIISQWQHSTNFKNLRYARWRNEGEVDIVCLTQATQKPLWIGEIKWSDRMESHPAQEMKSIQTLLKKHPSIKAAFMASKTIRKETIIDGKPVSIIPCALYGYTVGRNITSRLDGMPEPPMLNQTS